jgi:hypothetical protein
MRRLAPATGAGVQVRESFGTGKNSAMIGRLYLCFKIVTVVNGRDAPEDPDFLKHTGAAVPVPVPTKVNYPFIFTGIICLFHTY